MNGKIADAFNNKLNEKISSFKEKTGYAKEAYGSREGFLNNETQMMDKHFDEMKAEENRVCNVIDNVMFQVNGTSLIKRSFNAMKTYCVNKRRERFATMKMDKFHKDKMRSKLFQFWKKYDF